MFSSKRIKTVFYYWTHKANTLPHRHQTQQQFEAETLQTLGALATQEAVQPLHEVLQENAWTLLSNGSENESPRALRFHQGGCRRRTFILCSALSKPMSMLMMSKPDADLFFWWTPRKSAQRVWGKRQSKSQYTHVISKFFLEAQWH